MTRDRWDEVKAMIAKKFPIEYEGTEDNDDMIGTMEVVECEGPIGTLRLEYVTRPRETTSKTSGAYGKEEREYEDDGPRSPNVSFLRIFVWNENEDDWSEINSDLVEKL